MNAVAAVAVHLGMFHRSCSTEKFIMVANPVATPP
jgi:hypothetical protein